MQVGKVVSKNGPHIIQIWSAGFVSPTRLHSSSLHVELLLSSMLELLPQAQGGVLSVSAVELRMKLLRPEPVASACKHHNNRPSSIRDKSYINDIQKRCLQSLVSVSCVPIPPIFRVRLKF